MLNSSLNDLNYDTSFATGNLSTLDDHDRSINIQQQLHWAAAVLQLIQLYYTPVLVILGSIGNIISVFVFFNTKLRKQSSSYYLAALAISDTGFLITQFISWLNLVDLPLFKKSGYCQMTIYTSHVCSFLSVWLVVMFTVERFIAVRYPLHRLAVCTVTRARACIVILSLIALPIFSPYFVMAAPQVLTETSNNITYETEICSLVPKYAGLAFYYNHFDVFLTLILPFCIIVVLNTLICRAVHELAQVRRSLTLNSRKRQKQRNNCQRMHNSHLHRSFPHCSNSNQNKVTQMLLVVSTVFICLNLPSYILRLWVYINEYCNILPFDEPLMMVLQHYSNVLFATNFGINFVLYCISGQNFRKALCSLFRLKRTRRRTTENIQATVFSEYSRSAPATNSLQQRKLTSNNLTIEMQQLLPNTSTTSNIHKDANHYNSIVVSSYH